jgi:pyruvate dehydrogenase E2 component (dihydrolipoamide acetyltransferase)
MPTAISMPKLGMTMEEGTVVQWPLAVGDRVEKGDPLLVIESEKTEVDIEAPESGFFRHIYVEEGDTVPCGSLLGAITETADEAFDADAFHAAEDRPENKEGGALQVKLAPAVAKTTAPTERPVAPAARAAAKKLGLDPQQIPGTGPNGRVTKQDVEAYAAAREALVPVADGVSLEVLAAGEGDPVLLLPGLGTDASAFARQTPMLAERFRVLGVNPRGVGLSDAPEADAYDVAQTAADAAATVEGAVHVIGASLGAAAALELALTQPERVRSLVLITPFVTASPRLVAIGEGWRRVAAEATAETLAAALLPWFFSSGFLSDEAARGRTLRGLAQTVARVPARTLDRMTAGMLEWSGSRADDLAKLSMPTLVVAAGEDLLTPDAPTLAEAIPTAKLLVVEGAGHAVALESPDAVNEAIAAHLA